MADRGILVGAVIVARMTSSRFPGKSLAPVAGKPLLEWLVARCRRASNIGRVIVATTVNGTDDPIAELAGRLGTDCFRGSENDVLSRVLGAARAGELDVVVHLTGDCPLTDPAIIDEMVDLFFRERADYAKNFQWGEGADPALGFPNGLDVEVFRTEALAEVDRLTGDPWLREHVTEPLYTWPRFKAVTLPAPPLLARQDLRLCVDTREDYEMIKALFEALSPENPFFSALDAIRYLDAHPRLKELNRDVFQKKYTAAVVGLGLIGSRYDEDPKMQGINSHSGAYIRWSKTRLLGGCDPDQERRKAFREKWGLPDVFSDASEMLLELKPEIVSICTPSPSHGPLVRLCIEHGVKAIFCEKPFVADPREGEELVRLCRESNTLLAVNHWMRYSDLYGGLRQYIREGGLGRIWGGRYHYSKGAFNSGTHAVDILAYLLGDPISVTATERMDIGTGDENIGGVIRFSSDAVVHLTVGDYRAHFTTEMDLMGTGGRVRLADNDNTVELFETSDGREQSNVRELSMIREIPFATGRGGYMVNAISNLVDALEDRAEVICTGEDGLRAVRVMKKMHDSLRNNGRTEAII